MVALSCGFCFQMPTQQRRPVTDQISPYTVILNDIVCEGNCGLDLQAIDQQLDVTWTTAGHVEAPKIAGHPEPSGPLVIARCSLVTTDESPTLAKGCVDCGIADCAQPGQQIWICIGV